MKILAIIALLSICYLFWHFHKKPIDKWWKLVLASVAVFASGNFIFSFVPWRIFLIEAPIIVCFLWFFAGGILTSYFAFLLMKSLIKKDYSALDYSLYFNFAGFLFLFFCAILMSIFCYARAFLPLLAS